MVEKRKTKLDKACGGCRRANDRFGGAWIVGIAGYDGGIDEKKLGKDDGKDGE